MLDDFCCQDRLRCLVHRRNSIL